MAHRILLAATENWPNAAHFAHGFFAAGCEVAAFAPRSAAVRSSGFLTRDFVYNAWAGTRSMRAAIEAADPALVVCCDERALTILLELYDTETDRASPLARLVERSVGTPSSYKCILSRSASLEAMQEAGIRVPLTLPVEEEAALESALLKVGLPAFVKADETCGGQGVALVRSLSEAHAAYRKLVSPSRFRNAARFVRSRDIHRLLGVLRPATHRISVQRFVDGRLAASAFAASNGEVLASFSYDILDAHKNGLGPPKIIRPIDCPDMNAAMRTVAQTFGLSGAHGLDFIRDSAGAVHLIEINPRATRGGTLPFGIGRDIPHALASMVVPHPAGIRPALAWDVVDFENKSFTAPASSSARWSIPRLSAQ
jgi:ATP-grasp domain